MNRWRIAAYPSTKQPRFCAVGAPEVLLPLWMRDQGKIDWKPWENPLLPLQKRLEVSIAMGIPQNRWFIRENSIKVNDDSGGSPIYGNSMKHNVELTMKVDHFPKPLRY